MRENTRRGKMAHECPECGQTCYCGADIDDCCFNFEDDVMKCTHYLQCEREYDDEFIEVVIQIVR
jgi:hypothetical protein